MGYDISADYVDSTTTYEPRSTIIDSDFIGGHSKCKHNEIFFFLTLNALWMWVFNAKMTKIVTHQSS